MLYKKLESPPESVRMEGDQSSWGYNAAFCLPPAFAFSSPSDHSPVLRGEHLEAGAGPCCMCSLVHVASSGSMRGWFWTHLHKIRRQHAEMLVTDEDWMSARKERCFPREQSAMGAQAAHVWHRCSSRGRGWTPLQLSRRKYLHNPHHGATSTHHLPASYHLCAPSSLFRSIGPAFQHSRVDFYVRQQVLYLLLFTSKTPCQVSPPWGARALVFVLSF